ncbi:MAG: hypothetical protein ACHREM_23805 [Polyangiales bacterium]
MSIAMTLDACALTDVHVQLEVGRGVAAVEVRARVASISSCWIDFGPVLQAREAGREAPTIVAWSIRPEFGARQAALGGPRSSLRFEAPANARITTCAILRGERFVISTASPGPKSRIAFEVSSVWGTETIPARARWIDDGVPKLVEADVDKSARMKSGVLEGEQALVVDAGPALGGDGRRRDLAAFDRAIAGGGIEMLSALMTDLPVAIVDAPDDAHAIALIRAAARAALAASSSKEPLVAGVGQRLATAIDRGFLGCKRDDAAMPAKWPAVDEPLRATGLLDDESAGCPIVGELIAREHPSLSLAREGAAALLEATMAKRSELPRVGDLFRALARPVAASARASSRVRRAAISTVAVFAIGLAFVVLAELFGPRARRRSANGSRGIP